MKVIHITPKANLASIKRKGIVPSKPYLEHHLNYAKQYGHGGRIIYVFPDTNRSNNEKYIKDFIYFQTWGKPRNLFIMKVDKKNKSISSKELENIAYDHDYLDPKEYTILAFTLFNDDLLIKDTTLLHVQDKTMWAFDDIDERFSHNDKRMFWLKRKIVPDRIHYCGDATPVIRNNAVENVRLENYSMEFKQ